MRLRILFFGALALLLVHMTTHAATRLPVCSWIGPDSTAFFTNCISKNFDKIEREMDVDLQGCPKIAPEVDYEYQTCVKKNFRTLNNRLGLKLTNCTLLTEEVNVIYVACIQKNFKTIERLLP